MEFSFSVNRVLVEPITVVTSDTINPKKGGADGQGVKANLRDIIDKMGIASSKAQKLNNVISSAALLMATNHRIYLIKVPYCLRSTEEQRIYEKLIRTSELSQAPCAPATLGQPVFVALWINKGGRARIKGDFAVDVP